MPWTVERGVGNVLHVEIADVANDEWEMMLRRVESELDADPPTEVTIRSDGGTAPVFREALVQALVRIIESQGVRAVVHSPSER